QRNISALLCAWSDRRPLTTDELKGFEETVEERARAGVPLDEYLHAVTVAEAMVWDEVVARATPLLPEQVLEAMANRFAIVKAITRITATAHQRIELLTARETYERRALALRNLLRGNLGADAVRENASSLGLDPSRAYVAVRARARGQLDSDQGQRLLAGRQNHPPYAAFALSGDDVIGLLAETPSSTAAITVGVSAPVPLESVARASQEAQLAFDTAWALGLTGVFATGDLGLLAAVQQLPEMSQALRDKYIAPLHGSGSLGNELLLTVRAYLEGGSRREAAATKLHVHLNTVGYRIGRFCELTGADLTDFATLAELWWLFSDMDLRA
ncbi:MAG: hypothetical protein JWM71_626, partial [Solirubrobacteraceae bacterium]|nr:hypothetical protein [Solirubrobacteraceae bacterium]